MIVIGAGRVGTALKMRSDRVGIECTLVSRTEGWDALEDPPGDPVVLTVRNDDLPAVVERIPDHRIGDVVFIQNGMIRPWLRTSGFGHATRGLLFFAVPKVGAEPVIAGKCPFIGDCAMAMVRWFIALGIPSLITSWPVFCSYEAEKLIWNSAFGLICQVKGCTVGEVVEQHQDLLQELAQEMALVCRASLSVDVPLDHLMKELCTFSNHIPSYTGRVSEYGWRNGWFVQEAQQREVATPAHFALLRQAGFGDVLPAEAAPNP